MLTRSSDWIFNLKRFTGLLYSCMHEICYTGSTTSCWHISDVHKIEMNKFHFNSDGTTGFFKKSVFKIILVNDLS